MRPRARAIALTGAVASAALAWSGCNAILGNGDGEVAPVEQIDASSDAVAQDGGTTDVTPPIAEAGCDAHPQDDSKNCGRCGHDCLGGGCSGGVCLPVALAPDAGSTARAMVVGNEAAYLLDDHGLWRVDLATFATAQIFTPSGAATLGDLDLGPSRVVFGEIGGSDAGVRACPRRADCIDGGLVGTGFAPFAVTAGATDDVVAWTDGTGPRLTDPSGGPPVPVATDFVNGIAVRDRLFWSKNAALKSAALDGGDVRVEYASSDPSVHLYAVTADGFYVNELSAPSLVPPDGGASARFGGATAPAFRRVIPSGNEVYWLDTSGLLSTCTPAACTPRVLNNRPAVAFGLTATRVVWLENTGRLVALAR